MSTGDIGSVLDTLKFEVGHTYITSICHVSGDVFAVVYKGPDLDGFLCTFSCDSSGTMPATIIDSWEFEGTFLDNPVITKVATGIFLIAYARSDVRCRIISTPIAADGTLAKTIIDHFQPNGVPVIYGLPGNILNVGPTAFGVVLSAENGDGWIRTFGCTPEGIFGSCIIDEFEFDTGRCVAPRFCLVSGIVYAVAYDGGDSDGWVKTFSITTGGAIAGVPSCSLEFDTALCNNPSICKARDGFFAIAYLGPGNDGFLVIVEISDAGAITDPVKDSYEFEISYCGFPFVFPVGEGYLAVAYGNPLSHGVLKTFLCDAAGLLNSTTIDTLTFDSTRGEDPEFIHVSGDIYLISYLGPSLEGWLCTVNIESPAAPEKTDHLMLMGVH